MRIADVPEAALTAEPTPIPTKQVYDWDAMHQILLQKGFVIIESSDVRTLQNGAEECVQVKMFNSHMALAKKLKLRTKRISATRWFCTL